MPTITLENVSKYYKNSRRSGAGNRYEVGVENVNLTIGQGEFVFITGSSGAGKSTLLDLISENKSISADQLASALKELESNGSIAK